MSSSVCHILIFVKDDDGRYQDQNIYNFTGFVLEQKNIQE